MRILFQAAYIVNIEEEGVVDVLRRLLVSDPVKLVYLKRKQEKTLVSMLNFV